MSKVKKNTTKRYEAVFIVANKFTEEEVAAISSKVADIIKVNEGVIVEELDLGKRILAYPIKKYNHGHYKMIVFDAPRVAVQGVDRLIRQIQDILRHCVVDYVANPIVASPKAAEVKAGDKPKAKVKSKEGVNPEAPSDETSKETKETEEVENKSLENKLDDILAAKDLF